MPILEIKYPKYDWWKNNPGSREDSGPLGVYTKFYWSRNPSTAFIHISG